MKRLDPRLVGRVCCPICSGEFEAREGFLDCCACQLAFPVLDGVPILLPARAKKRKKAMGTRKG